MIKNQIKTKVGFLLWKKLSADTLRHEVINNLWYQIVSSFEDPILHKLKNKLCQQALKYVSD